MRDVELPYVGLIENIEPLLRASASLVAAHEESGAYVAVLLAGVPEPVMVMPMPLRTVIPLVQVQKPAGI